MTVTQCIANADFLQPDPPSSPQLLAFLLCMRSFSRPAQAIAEHSIPNDATFVSNGQQRLRPVPFPIEAHLQTSLGNPRLHSRNSKPKEKTRGKY